MSLLPNKECLTIGQLGSFRSRRFGCRLPYWYFVLDVALWDAWLKGVKIAVDLASADGIIITIIIIIIIKLCAS